MIDFSAEFQKFIEDRIEEIIDEITEKNIDYARDMAYLEKNCEKFEKIINKLPDRERDFINEYENNSYRMNRIERKEFYYRGYKDCIKLLKWLGMI